MLPLLTKRHNSNHTEVSFLMPPVPENLHSCCHRTTFHYSVHVSFGHGLLSFGVFLEVGPFLIFCFMTCFMNPVSLSASAFLQCRAVRSKHLCRAVVALPDSSSWAFMEPERIYSPAFCCELCVGWQNE